MLQNVKIRDKKELVKYNLCVNIFKRFNFKVEDVIPVRKVFILITDQGNKILKKINYDIDELEFIYAGIKYIRNNGFDRVFEYTLTKDNKIYTICNKDLYCVMDLIEGRESEYSNPIDIAIASQGLGELHKACEGFRYNGKTRCVYGNTIDSFKRKLYEMELFKNIASLSEKKSEFDDIFLDNVDYYKDKIKDSINILEKSSFYKLCSQEDKKILCHHDLAHHNILIKEDKSYFVDFDYCIIDLKVHDLCNFINKAEKKSAYDIEFTNTIIENYCMYNELNKKELEVLYGMLTFPQDFYTISKQYYTRTKEWEYKVFLQRLIKKNEFKEDKEEFLKKFKDNI
ncbi:CotS family spore coat protein [Clostridium aestuarii]|uniref:CotS family spore coat protein n=1 Tax=Clostridium aestuarii TaxID=338193 RepID=A0ABT4D2W4_9CLOT|nr:CotS family spore coat protein [Clostridium aestuarii]MCY6485584.1 CotS family spore coat protein [Clostridium aestuarii]